MKFHVGFGYDVHRLDDGLPLTIGGVKIDYPKGWVAHSDGDVLIHAICDAILGAANMRDIGFHFPDSDPQFKGVSSLILLQQTVDIVASKGYRVVNVDSTIAMQRPKLKDFIPQMSIALADAMHVSPDDVSVKATTTEGLSFEGDGSGASAYAVAMIEKD